MVPGIAIISGSDNLVVLAEVGIETIAGGGVTGMLVMVMLAFLRRTKDTDERRDHASKLITDALMAREAQAWARGDRLEQERDAARVETAQYRALLEEERRSRKEEERWSLREIEDLRRRTRGD